MPDALDAVFARILSGTPARDCEASTLDFKEDVGSRTDLEASIVKAAICFANAAGGVIVLGVADKAHGADAFRGTGADPDALRERIHANTKPGLLVDAEVRTAPARLVVLRVGRSAAVHADTAGRSWQRVNKACLPLAPDDYARLAEERRGYDWSSEASGTRAAAVPAEALAAARRLLRNLADDRRSLAELGDEDLLSALGVLVPGERGWLTRSGELMFCPPCGGAAADAVVYQYRATPGGEPRAVERVPTPLLTAFERALGIVSARQSATPLTLPSGQQIAIPDFPAAAVREALSNALCHRDWRMGGSVTLDHSPEVLVVTSPGPLVSGVTPENILTTTSNPRNRSLARAARALGLAEEVGRGVDRMFREAVRSGKTLPTIEGLYDKVRVSFAGGAPDTNVARFVAQMPGEEQDDTDTMILLHHLCRFRTVTALQAAPILQKPEAEAAVVLRRLAGDAPGLLEPTRESAARAKPTYRLRGEAVRGLGAAVAYNRRTVDDTDRKVVAHVREYGRITNRTLQNFLDVPMLKARDILGDLSQRGVLVRVSEQTRGPKVEWGPGPNFPRRRGADRPSSAADSPEARQPELPLARAGRPRRSRTGAG